MEESEKQGWLRLPAGGGARRTPTSAEVSDVTEASEDVESRRTLAGGGTCGCGPISCESSEDSEAGVLSDGGSRVCWRALPNVGKYEWRFLHANMSSAECKASTVP
jgi:hypothetical protein